MPYGIPKEHGGDSKENVKWMEGCVSRVEKRTNPDTKKPYGKSSAIAICKTILMRRKGKASRDQLLNFYLEHPQEAR